jgi:hypothetical protein
MKLPLESFLLLLRLFSIRLQCLVKKLIVELKLLYVVLVAVFIFFNVALKHFNVFFSLQLFVPNSGLVLLYGELMLFT